MKKQNSKRLFSFLLLSLALLPSCAVQIPNTKACAVAGIMEGGMDCFYTLSDDEEFIKPENIRDFLEAQPEVKDLSGKVVQAKKGAAICQPLTDWSAEHTALELACNKLGSACTYDIKKMIDSVGAKVDSLGTLQK